MSLNKQYKYDRPLVNKIKDAVKEFGDVPAAYADLIDLDTPYVWERLLVNSRLNARIMLKFSTGEEITVLDNESFAIDIATMYGKIQFKYLSAPTAGVLHIICS